MSNSQQFDAPQKAEMSFENGSQPGPPFQHSLFLVVQTTGKKVKHVNPALINYCELKDTSINDSPEIYKEIMHPEDYSRYLEHLESFTDHSCKKEKYISVRLKNRNGSWVPFCFKDRLYNWNPDGGQLILSQVYPLDDNNNEISSQKAVRNEYGHLLQSLDEAFCIVEMIFDENGTPVDYIFQEINPAFEKQINHKDVTGKTMRELIPDHEEHWFQTYGKVALTGKSHRSQYKAAQSNNSWLDLYAFRVGDHNSRRVVVIFHNITDRKLAEEQMNLAHTELEKNVKKRQKELEESNDLLQTVFDTTNQGIAVFRTLYDEAGDIKDFRFIKINKVLLEMYSDQNPLGQTYLETSKHGVKMGIFDELKKVMKTGKSFDKEIYFNKEGYNNWFRITARPQRDLLIATLEDITERKAKAQELKDTIRFKQKLVRTSPETIMIINLNSFTVRYINKDIYPEVGMTKEKIQGMPLANILPFIHPRDREKVLALHKKLLKAHEEEIFDIEVRLKLKGKTWEWFSVRGTIFNRRDDNWVDEYVVLVRNITQLKNTQKALLRAEKFSIQGEIARTLAHELRNPIGSIGMAIDVLRNKLDKDQKERLNNYFEILSRSNKTLNNLVSNLLNSSNYSPPVLKKENLCKIVSQAVSKAGDRIYLAGLKVVKKYKGSYYVLADKEKLEIAILNIIVNASEATRPDKGVIEIEITEHTNNELKLSITDNGHGLEEKQIDRLFEAFYTNKQTGVGVGLNSVKNILEEHDARIEVNSKPNEGASFIIFFHNAELE